MDLSQKIQLFNILGYAPYAEQMAVHECPGRVIAIFGGERAGKSTTAAIEGMCDLFPTPDDMRYKRIAVSAQSYDETRVETEYLLSWCRQLGMMKGEPSTPKQGKWQWETYSGSVETVSLEGGAGELTGKGKPFDCVLLVEAGRIAYDAFMAATGRVSERRGRVILSGTMWLDYGWYADLYEQFAGPNEFDGKRFSLPSWCNRAVYPGGREDAEIRRLERIWPENEFARRIAAAPLPSPARIYPEFGHAVHVVENEVWDPGGPVDLSIDPGYFPCKYAVLVLQGALSPQGERVVNVVDSLWNDHMTHQDAIAWVKEQPYWTNVLSVYGGHETKQHPSQKSAQEVWAELTGRPFVVVPRLAAKVDGIMRVKTYLEDPATKRARLFICKRCQGLLWELPRYERKKDRFGTVVSSDPDPHAADDALDALTNYLVGRFGLVDKVRRSGRRGQRSVQARG